MIINDINLNSLSREEYISLIVILLNSFILDYEYFTKDEKKIIYFVVNGYDDFILNPKESD